MRLGDGEGTVLARPRKEWDLVSPSLHGHFGPHVTPDQISSLAGPLAGAVDSADIVGIRDDLVGVDFPPESFDLDPEAFTHRFRRAFHLREIERNLPFAAAYRLALLHRFLTTEPFRGETVFCSAWIHFLLSSEGALTRILRGQERVGLISSRPELARDLTRLFGLRVDYHQVPDRFTGRGPDHAGPPHFPAVFERTLEALEVPSPGQLFLVGAGVCGKVYCHRIKELGGFGLDVGSVCDAWLGIPSRMLVLDSLFGSTEVPASLRLAHQAKDSW
ncbi:MAG: hypothetical protein GY929_03090 [Actinomycetia bacterium]|nr:hypothetical protein [Actinomycetes bacterium]